MGIIQPSPSIGYVICSFSFDRIYENIFYHLLPNSSNLMIEMDYIRGALELFFLEEAMDSLNDDILERMKKALDGMEENLEMKKRITECDRIFHFALYENVKNSMFHSIERITWDLHPTLRVQDEEKYFDHIKRTLKIHKDFYNAVRKNDREKARKVWNCTCIPPTIISIPAERTELSSPLPSNGLPMPLHRSSGRERLLNHCE